MVSVKRNDNPIMLFYGWYIKGDREYVKEMGQKIEKQIMYPHYMIEVKKSIGSDIKVGLLYGFNERDMEYYLLNESNISGDILLNAMKEDSNEALFLYIMGFGVWKINGISIDTISVTIQMTRSL